MMRLRVQWATSEPGDWTEVHLAATGVAAGRWKNLPKKPVPTDRSMSKDPGWIMALEADGLLFEGFDHYAVKVAGTASDRFLQVTAWNDDEEDFSDPQALGYRWGEVWEIHGHRADNRFGGKENTYQIKTVYSEDLVDMGRFFPQETSGGSVQLRPWSEFPLPDEVITKHGVWLPEEVWAAHYPARRPADWRGWS